MIIFRGYEQNLRYRIPRMDEGKDSLIEGEVEVFLSVVLDYD